MRDGDLSGMRGEDSVEWEREMKCEVCKDVSRDVSRDVSKDVSRDVCWDKSIDLWFFGSGSGGSNFIG